MCEVWHRGYECGSVLVLSDVGWSWRVVKWRVPGVSLSLDSACVLMQCVGCVRYECGSELFLFDVDWSWRVVVGRVSGEGLCLGLACLLMQCCGYVVYKTSRQSCGRCLMAFV